MCYGQYNHPAQTLFIQVPAASCGISTSWKIRGEKTKKSQVIMAKPSKKKSHPWSKSHGRLGALHSQQIDHRGSTMPPSTEMCISTARRPIHYVNIFKEIIYFLKILKYWWQCSSCLCHNHLKSQSPSSWSLCICERFCWPRSILFRK